MLGKKLRDSLNKTQKKQQKSQKFSNTYTPPRKKWPLQSQMFSYTKLAHNNTATII